MKIGVFDSGVGGQAVANAIQRELPEAELLVREDRANLPYGNKTPEVLLQLVTPILAGMVADGCQIIVVACNTVTTTIIDELRKTADVPLVAVEPMIKPAVEQTVSGVIAVCATPATLNSARYQTLKSTYAKNTLVLEPDCSDWAFMIETDTVDVDQVAERIKTVLAKGADVVVLACTHYHWIEQEITLLCEGRAKVLQPEKPLIAQLKRVIAQLS